jgi:hypothetical protein
MIKLILIYIALCVLTSLISRDLDGSTKTKSFVFKFFCNIILTPLFGWVVVWFLNLPTDGRTDEEIWEELNE